METLNLNGISSVISQQILWETIKLKYVSAKNTTGFATGVFGSSTPIQNEKLSVDLRDNKNVVQLASIEGDTSVFSKRFNYVVIIDDSMLEPYLEETSWNILYTQGHLSTDSQIRGA